MKVGCFTPLLSALPLDAVLKKLAALGLDGVGIAARVRALHETEALAG